MSSAKPKATAGAGEIRIGISGWRYPPWRGGAFYPKGLAQHRELEYASRALPSIELNGSFYSLQRPENYAAWYADTPADFVFSVKGSRYITHMLRLNNVETALANFFASGIAKGALARWARRIRRWSDGREPSDARRIVDETAAARRSRDVFCYFDNTDKVEAPDNAQRLMKKLGVVWPK